MIRFGLKRLFILGLLAISAYSYSQNKLKDSYPVPAKTDKLLFYLQRSKNRNTIIYELNTSPDGKLNQEEPVHPYWLRYEEGGKKMELSYIQKTMAFGIDTKMTDKLNGSYNLTLVSYKERTLFLQKRLINKKNIYRVFVIIKGKISLLQSIFVNAVDNYFGYPEVKSIELFGTDLTNGSNVYEKIPIG